MMAHIDHGSWIEYTPVQRQANAPSNAVYAKRESDGQDWYLYVHPGTNFEVSTVKFTAVLEQAGYVVAAAVYEADRLFPANQSVFEIDGYSGTDPQADFGGKLYIPDADAFMDVPPTKQQEANTYRAGGLTVDFTASSPGLGTYPVDQSTNQIYNGISTRLANGDGFPGNAATVSILDINNVGHDFNKVDFGKFGRAVSDFAYYCNQYAQGQITTLPPNTVTF